MIDDVTGGRPLHHVGIAVHSLDDAGRLFQLLSEHSGSEPERLESQGVRVAFHGPVELLEPLAPDTTVGRFLARRGPGLHHIAYATSDLVADLERLDRAGVRLIDREPRPGAHGHRVAFLHPESTGGILVELVEEAPDPSDALPT